jgi:methylmalonyl-CoA/ethylmalonyl-CoA epimerase
MAGHNTPIRVEHIGIAVEEVESAEQVLIALGCKKILDDVVDDRFRWAYYDLGDGSRLELIEPVSDDSFLTDFLDREGPGLHHVTLEVGDIHAIMETLKENGLRVVDYREYEEWMEAFVSPKNPTGTLFQLMEFRDAYAQNHKPDASELFVNGHPVGSQ